MVYARSVVVVALNDIKVNSALKFYNDCLLNICYLFNVSSVMEARASTQLGENVNLLTSMSIFSLPLSLCMVIASYLAIFFSY